jgi:hypothetical protein
MKLTTIALAFIFALSSTFALAGTGRHRSGVRTYHMHRGLTLFRSGSHSTYGASAGGVMWNGRSASEFGGD